MKRILAAVIVVAAALASFVFAQSPNQATLRAPGGDKPIMARYKGAVPMLVLADVGNVAEARERLDKWIDSGGVGAVWVKTKPSSSGLIRVSANHSSLGKKSVEIQVVQEASSGPR